MDNASSVHGVGRVGSDFNLNEVASEYRALCASVPRLWHESTPAPDLNDLDDITRFNETIHQSLAKEVASYTHRVNQSRRMFLAILGHGLRKPLSCISTWAQLASRIGIGPSSSESLSQIETRWEAVSRLIQGLPTSPRPGWARACHLSWRPSIWRESQRQRRVSGVVLGLYIAHDIVISHGGTIDVTSSAESGAVFTAHVRGDRAQC